MKYNKNAIKKIFVLVLLLMPIFVLAKSDEEELSLFAALGMEAFVSMHMSAFVLLPLARIFAKENSKKVFWVLFTIRILYLLIFDLFITTSVAFFDFLSVFIGAFIIVPISVILTSVKEKVITNNKISSNRPGNTVVNLKCQKCNFPLKANDKFCANCGEQVAEVNETTQIQTKKLVFPTNFDNIYSLSEDSMLEEFIKQKLVVAGIDKSSKLIPAAILKRKKVLHIIYSFLIFIFITLIFFHFPLYTYIIGLILLVIFFLATRKYDLIQYLKKQIKARPQEKIINIIMNAKATFTEDNSKGLLIKGVLVAAILPLIIFNSPIIIYEKVPRGYAVRYYIFGWTNFKTATIPETYKGENVVTLRGNTFSNMPFLKSVKLPDSIRTIRGQAFKNCTKLAEVNIPEKLGYLGGGAFYNAKSIKHIELPDTLTYLGGEAFYGATSLEYIRLSNNLSEIRGDSFEYCTSLQSITIPDNVTRIGGHAFYGDSSLSEVSISENSNLAEIGSSAFRLCSSLSTITIPADTYVNERAFKESPTTVNRYGNLGELPERIYYGNESPIKRYEKLHFADYNISLKLNQYEYYGNGYGKGSFIVDFNDGVHKDIIFNFAITGNTASDAVSFVYSDYVFMVKDLQENEVSVKINLNINYSANYKYKARYSYIKAGDNYNLPNSSYNVKLEKINVIGSKYEYIFSCNGKEFAMPIGNGATYFTNHDNNMMIAISTFYGSSGVYLSIYYN